MRPGEYAYDLGRRQVVCLTHVDSTFIEGLNEGGEIRSALVGNFVALETKPTWWRLRGRLDEYRSSVANAEEQRRRLVHRSLDALVSR